MAKEVPGTPPGDEGELSAPDHVELLTDRSAQKRASLVAISTAIQDGMSRKDAEALYGLGAKKTI